MAENTISAEELIEAARDGGDIEAQPRLMAIEGFDELIAKIEQMIKADEARTDADAQRNQTNLEILATLQALIRKGEGGAPATPIDLRPLQSMFSKILLAQQQGPVTYEFDVKRGPGGYIAGIVARPVTDAVH